MLLYITFTDILFTELLVGTGMVQWMNFLFISLCAIYWRQFTKGYRMRGGLTIWKLGHCPRARGQYGAP
ncbi:unnamed protein product [Staurois parvus]|uniref:Uncharacterized protein n=1 Tax=Staurois parvus TaxID=386267 RepID=A0ABN9APU2_9NEOB|nr:unnamed protein product [Staurois parvus]